VRRSALSEYKIVSRHPLTDQGWADAWHELEQAAPAMAEKVRVVLARRADNDRATAPRRQLDAGTLAYLPQLVLLGGYFPGVEFTAGATYDVRFLADRLAVLPCGSVEPMGELAYREIEKVDIGGPGLVKSGGGFAGGGFGVAGAAEGMAIAAVLNAATTRTKIKTVIQVQAAHAEMFFLHTRTAPEALRIALSRAIGALREARAEHANSSPGDGPPGPATVVSELAKLASMLESGLLTRKEFDHLKARLIAGS
jgi:hypothetical protein